MDVLNKPLVVLNTVEKGDVGISQGALSIPEIAKMRLNDISSVQILQSRAEVQKTYVLGATDPTIVAKESYYLQIVSERPGNQGWDRFKRDYYVTAPSDVTNQSVARTALYNSFIDRIAKDIDIPIVASINSDGDLELKDRPGYFLRGRKGESQIRVIKNNNGVGFDAADLVVTKKAVYGIGIGSELVKKQFNVDPLIGNAISGQPYYAKLDKVDTGSNYTTVIINSIVGGNGVGVIAESLVMKWIVQYVLVKEGTEGYDEFMKYLTEAAIYKVAKDQPSMAASGLFPPDLIGSANTGATGVNAIKIGDSLFYSANSLAATNAALGFSHEKGYELKTDLTAGKGREICTVPDLEGPSFVVGKGTFSISGVFNVGTLTNGQVLLGFREKGDVVANYKTYDNLAVIGNDGGGTAFKTIGNSGTGTGTVTDPSVVGVSGKDFQLDVIVQSDGSVKAFYNGQQYVVNGAAGPVKLEKGAELIGFIRFNTIATGESNAFVKRFECFPFDTGKTSGGIL